MLMMLRLQYGAENDLKDVDDSNIGLAGSPTKIAKASDKVRKGSWREGYSGRCRSGSFIHHGQIKRETCNLKIIRKSGDIKWV